MIPEVGQYALILALALAIVQVVCPLWGAYKNNTALMQLSRFTAIGQWVFVSISFAVLAFCFLTNDFSVAYVAKNSNTHLPAFYRFCAIWGAHEGSMLLWIFILTVWMGLVSVFSKQLPLDMLARVLAVLAMIAIGFYVFLLTSSDPFLRWLPNVPRDGASLNPILQDPGLSIHPPMLYMGYVGFSVAFAFAIAALLRGKLDSTWARWSRPWTIVAWSFLTLGIVLGSAWAYRDLGWGGFWFWDPVENASFLPWLVGTALIHSLVVTEKRGVFKAWTVLLAVCAFSLSLMGTFLVRSGVLISVHAFAVDPARGLYMLRFLCVVIGGSLALYAWRARHIVNTGEFGLSSRETMLLTNNVLLFVAMVTVLLGTLYPLIIQALHLGKLSVGAPYFNTVFVPLMIPAFFLMGVAPLFHWQQTNVKRYIKRFLILLLASISLAVLLPWWAGALPQFWVCLGLSAALWILLNSVMLFTKKEQGKHRVRLLPRAQWPMLLAHVGVAVTVVGITLTTAYSEKISVSMKPGDQVQLAGYTFLFTRIAGVKGSDYVGDRAQFIVRKGQRVVATLAPEIRVFSPSQSVAAKAAIQPSMVRDVYVALGSSLRDNAWSVRIFVKPFVRWIWAGGLLMVLAGALAVALRHGANTRTAHVVSG